MLLCLLDEKVLELLDRLQYLQSTRILFVRASLETVDVAAVLVFDVCTLLSHCSALLLSSLLRGKPFGVGSDEAIVLLVELDLPMLKTFPLLQSSTNLSSHTLHLALDLGFGVVELARKSVLVVALLFPLLLLRLSLLNFVHRYLSQAVNLEHKVSGCFIGLTDVLLELKYALALALVIASGIGKAVAESFHLLSDSSNGGLVILLTSLQAVTLLL